jgi:lysophospholipase L1-like esterase
MLSRIMTAAAVAVAIAGSSSAARARSGGGPDEPKVVGALGDSISTGFDALHLGDNRDLSWATGTSDEVNSHLKRLEAYLNTPLIGENEAVAGSTAVDLNKQITRLLPNHPAYVTIDIGANDVCDWEAETYDASLTKFEADVQAAIQRIVDAEPDARITLAPIPDVYNLWEVASQQSGCQFKWTVTGLCKPLLAKSRTQEERLAFKDRWAGANDALARVAANFPQQVLFNENAIDVPFTWEDVSTIDCFHPSVKGQNLLAEKTWLYER